VKNLLRWMPFSSGSSGVNGEVHHHDVDEERALLILRGSIITPAEKIIRRPFLCNLRRNRLHSLTVEGYIVLRFKKNHHFSVLIPSISALCFPIMFRICASFQKNWEHSTYGRT
jgi:hypothetical protein